MIEDDIYVFRIGAYSPETIPMARLAEYMTLLSTMFGEKDSVHFQGLEKGSTKLISRVVREAAPKVRKNLNNAASIEGSEAATSFKRLNEMLRKDNAEADLTRDGATILIFPGKKQIRPPKLGPFTQEVVKDGVLVRIGGKDKSAHAIIEDSDGNTWSFEVTRDLAKDLARHLFEKPVRLKGSGRLHRDEEGQWQYNSLKAVEFQRLNDDTLAEVVARIRALPLDTWKPGINHIAMLQSLRD